MPGNRHSKDTATNTTKQAAEFSDIKKNDMKYSMRPVHLSKKEHLFRAGKEVSAD